MSTTMTIWAVLVILGLFLVGGVFLQIFLSRRESRWPGLVLPALTFLNSLVVLLSIANVGQSVWQTVLTVAVTVLAGNIPTLVLLAIYWAAREKLRKRSELEKMKIDDL